MKGKSKHLILHLLFIFFVAAVPGCSNPLSTREKAAGIGALGGATVGGIIGSAVGHPGVGAAVGGTLGLGAGALIGDQLQGQELKQQEQQRQIDQQKSDIAKNQALIEELKRHKLEVRETERGVAVNLPSINFLFDSAKLTPDGRDQVNAIARILNQQAPGRRVSIEGHASRERPEQETYNQKLSEQRAETVAESLVEAGINANRINTKGFGTRAPVASNQTEDGRQKNRRVEVVIEN